MGLSTPRLAMRGVTLTMKKLSFLLAILMTLTGCATGPTLGEKYASITQTMALETNTYHQKHGKKSTIEAGKKAVKQTLKDPESAQFTNLRIGKYGDGILVCGNVNAKNSFGGYVGTRPFAASPSVAVIYEDYEYAFLTEAANTAIIQGCR